MLPEKRETLSSLLDNEKPRERLYRYGPEALSDCELVSILLGSGTSKCDVFGLSKKVLEVVDRENGSLSVASLEELNGVGRAKAALVVAALEFSRRRIRPRGVRITNPAHALKLVRHLGDREQEHFVCITLNGANEAIATRVITVGLVNSSQVHPREVFVQAISDRACSIIVAHNHPSGVLEPSSADIHVTNQLRQAGETLGIKVLDHLIFSSDAYYSFQEAGLL